MTRAVAAIVFLLLTPLAADAQGLSGISRVSVRLEGLDWEAISSDLTREDIELAVYVRFLRTIPDLTVDLVERTAPWITVKVESVPVRVDGADIGYAVNVVTSLVRSASLQQVTAEEPDSVVAEGDLLNRIDVPVWSDSTLFVSGTAALAENVMSVIETHLDVFAASFQVANPQ